MTDHPADPNPDPNLDPDLDRLAAEHVLGLLDPEEARRAERLTEGDPAFAGAVAAWRERLSELDATAPPREPSEGLWARIAANLEAPAQAPAQVRLSDPSRARAHARRAGPRALWNSLPFWRGGALAAAALALAFGLAALRPSAPTPVLVAVLLTEGTSRPAAVVNAFADGRTELVPLEDIAVPPGRVLEIWTLWDRARGPVSVGLIPGARSVRLRLDDLPRGPNQLFEITLEPAGGSPTGRPTGPILMKGTTATAL